MSRLLCVAVSLLALSLPAAAWEYHIWMEVSPGTSWSVSGEETITGVAPGTAPEVILRLYPAARTHFALEGAWDGEGERIAWDTVDPTAAVLPLPLEEGQTVSFTLAFHGEVPPFPGGSYGTFAAGEEAVVLSQAYPILAAWDHGWVVEPVLPWGDALVADVADYTLDLRFPPDWTALTNATDTLFAPGHLRALGQHLRELVIVLLRDASSLRAEGEPPIVSYFPQGNEAAGAEAAAICRRALELYGERFGTYPFPEFKVVAVPLEQAAGVEYPGLILAESHYYEEVSRGLRPLFWPMIFAHEAAHQWWYTQVGNDQVREPWLDEALATFTSGLYFRAIGRWEEIRSYWERTWHLGKERNPEAGITSPLWAFPEGKGYGGIVYSGGALFLEDLREAMGDDAFFGALRRYLEDFRWKLAHGEDLLGIFMDLSPVPLEEIFRRWGIPTPRAAG